MCSVSNGVPGAETSDPTAPLLEAAAIAAATKACCVLAYSSPSSSSILSLMSPLKDPVALMVDDATLPARAGNALNFKEKNKYSIHINIQIQSQHIVYNRTKI